MWPCFESCFQNHAPPVLLGPESAQSVQHSGVCATAFTLCGVIPLTTPPCLLYAMELRLQTIILSCNRDTPPFNYGPFGVESGVVMGVMINWDHTPLKPVMPGPSSCQLSIKDGNFSRLFEGTKPWMVCNA